MFIFPVNLLTACNGILNGGDISSYTLMFYVMVHIYINDLAALA